MNLIDVTRDLATDEQCMAFLEKMRWPDGIVRCPTCGNDKISKITRKTASKNKRKSVYQCLEKTCKQQFSATNGSIYHDSHLPLYKWFMATALIVDAKKSLSAKQLQQHLGIGSYKTAWYVCHRIRKAMEQTGPKLTGIAELDETYIGGKAKRRDGRSRNPKVRSEKFDLVLGMRERGGRVRFAHIPDGKAVSIRAAVDKHIDPSIEYLYTDSASKFPFALAGEWERKHLAVNHSTHWVVPGTNIHTNTVESSFSLLKRGLIGSFHRVSIKHLHRYLTEFEYRFNERRNAERFELTVAEMLKTKPMPMKQLTADAF